MVILLCRIYQNLPHSRDEVYCQLSASHTYHYMHRSFAIATALLPEDRAGPLIGVMVSPQSDINRKFLQSSSIISNFTLPHTLS